MKRKSALRLASSEDGKETQKTQLLDRISGFFYKRRKAVFVAVGVLLAVLVVLGVCLVTADKREDGRQVEAASLQDETKKLFEGDHTPEQYGDLVQRLEDLAKRGGRRYSGLKATYVLGLAYMEAKDWPNAYDAFIKVSGSGPKSYLAPLALYNAAVAKEEGGESEEALRLYEKVPADYGYDTSAAPRALFNSARLHLGKGEVDLAKSTYQQIIDKYPQSEYTALSKNKLLSL